MTLNELNATANMLHALALLRQTVITKSTELVTIEEVDEKINIILKEI